MLPDMQRYQKKKEVYKCSEYSKQFPYHSLLKKHLVAHRQSHHCNTCKRVFKHVDHFPKHGSDCTEIIPSFISSVLHSTTADFEALYPFVKPQVLKLYPYQIQTVSLFHKSSCSINHF